MVTSTMKPPATADVPPARFGVGTNSSGAVIITVLRPGEGGEVEVRFPDGSTQTIADLRRTNALSELVRSGMSSDPPKTDVVINADRDLPHSAVREVSQMVGEVEGIRLFLGVQDK